VHRDSPANSRANRRHCVHRVRAAVGVTPSGAAARDGSNLFTVYLLVDSAGAEMVARPGIPLLRLSFDSTSQGMCHCRTTRVRQVQLLPWSTKDLLVSHRSSG
jgi:hypothetical protein